METPTLSKVTVLERFDLGGKTYAPGTAQVPSDKVEGLLKKKLIVTDETLDDEQRLSGSTLEAELLNVLAPHIAENGQNEGALETLYRIMAERDELRQKAQTYLAESEKKGDMLGIANNRADIAEGRIVDLQSQIETLRFQNIATSPAPTIEGDAVDPNSSAQVQVTDTETTVNAKELTPLVGAKGAIALVNNGFNTREKIQSATDKELDDLDGITDKSIEKLRAEFGVAQPNP